ncbi:MAG: hypothetical protein OEV94_12015 [Deltaproteobacteria bacterium]|nr:hypothetical protein [Deltaproteobacteria bacterium]
MDVQYFQTFIFGGIGAAIFVAGGAWYELRQIRRDMDSFRDLMIKVPVLEERTEKHEQRLYDLERRQWRPGAD